MLSTTWFQVVITIWLAKFPVTHTIPKIYSIEECSKRAEQIVDHIKARKPRMSIECVPTDKRDA